MTKSHVLTSLSFGVYAPRRCQSCALLTDHEKKRFIIIVFRDEPQQADGRLGKALQHVARRFWDKNNPFSWGDESPAHRVVALEIEWSSIVGLDYRCPLHDDGKLVLEARQVVKRCFKMVEDVRDYYWPRTVAVAPTYALRSFHSAAPTPSKMSFEGWQGPGPLTAAAAAAAGSVLFSPRFARPTSGGHLYVGPGTALSVAAPEWASAAGGIAGSGASCGREAAAAPASSIPSGPSQGHAVPHRSISASRMLRGRVLPAAGGTGEAGMRRVVSFEVRGGCNDHLSAGETAEDGRRQQLRQAAIDGETQVFGAAAAAAAVAAAADRQGADRSARRRLQLQPGGQGGEPGLAQQQRRTRSTNDLISMATEDRGGQAASVRSGPAAAVATSCSGASRTAAAAGCGGAAAGCPGCSSCRCRGRAAATAPDGAWRAAAPATGGGVGATGNCCSCACSCACCTSRRAQQRRIAGGWWGSDGGPQLASSSSSVWPRGAALGCLDRCDGLPMSRAGGVGWDSDAVAAGKADQQILRRRGGRRGEASETGTGAAGLSGGCGGDAEAVPRASRWTRPSATFGSSTLVLSFRDPILPQELRRFVKSDMRLLKMYESGLPPWAVFLPCYGLPYRPWMRRVLWLLFIAISIFSMGCGFYDLYKHVPFLKQVVTALASRMYLPASELFEWLERHTQIRMSILLTYLFSKSPLLMSLMRMLRSLAALLQQLLAPLLAALSTALAPVGAALRAAGAGFAGGAAAVSSVVWQLVEPAVDAVGVFGQEAGALAAAVMGPPARAVWGVLVLLAQLARLAAALVGMVLVGPLQLACSAAEAMGWLGAAAAEQLAVAWEGVLWGLQWAVTLGRAAQRMAPAVKAGARAAAQAAGSASAVAGAASGSGVGAGMGFASLSSGMAVWQWLGLEVVGAYNAVRLTFIQALKSAQAVMNFCVTVAQTAVQHRVSLLLQIRRFITRQKERLPPAVAASVPLPSFVSMGSFDMPTPAPHHIAGLMDPDPDPDGLDLGPGSPADDHHRHHHPVFDLDMVLMDPEPQLSGLPHGVVPEHQPAPPGLLLFRGEGGLGGVRRSGGGTGVGPGGAAGGGRGGGLPDPIPIPQRGRGGSAGISGGGLRRRHLGAVSSVSAGGRPFSSLTTMYGTSVSRLAAVDEEDYEDVYTPGSVGLSGGASGGSLVYLDEPRSQSVPGRGHQPAAAPGELRAASGYGPYRLSLERQPEEPWGWLRASGVQSSGDFARGPGLGLGATTSLPFHDSPPPGQMLPRPAAGRQGKKQRQRQGQGQGPQSEPQSISSQHLAAAAKPGPAAVPKQSLPGSKGAAALPGDLGPPLSSVSNGRHAADVAKGPGPLPQERRVGPPTGRMVVADGPCASPSSRCSALASGPGPTAVGQAAAAASAAAETALCDTAGTDEAGSGGGGWMASGRRSRAARSTVGSRSGHGVAAEQGGGMGGGAGGAPEDAGASSNKACSLRAGMSSSQASRQPAIRAS